MTDIVLECPQCSHRFPVTDALRSMVQEEKRRIEEEADKHAAYRQRQMENAYKRDLRRKRRGEH